MLLDYDFSIRYHSTEAIGHADVLSRFMDTQSKIQDSVIISVLAFTVRALPVTSQMICEATPSDPLLKEVLHFHHTEQPKVCTDKIFNASFSIIVPSTLQNSAMKQFHFGHQGISYMKTLAHSYVY